MSTSPHIIGRRAELKILQDRLASNQAEFIAVYGRRRVGKTFLIRNAIGSRSAILYSNSIYLPKATSNMLESPSFRKS